MSAPSSAPWPLETVPEPRRYADESAQEIEDVDATVDDAPDEEPGRPTDRFLGRETRPSPGVGGPRHGDDAESG